MNISDIKIGQFVKYTGPSIALFDRQATVINVFDHSHMAVLNFASDGPVNFHACAQHIAPLADASPAPAFLLHADLLRTAGALLVDQCHGAAKAAGWYTDLKTGQPKVLNTGERLMLIVTEVAEGMEGYRKNLMDDHLVNRTMLEVEMADAVIRIADLCGSLGLDLGGAIADKMAYNAVRVDHKPEARLAANGKSC